MPPTALTVSFSQLQDRVGHYLYGIRSGFSGDQTSDINDCIRDGINRVYGDHDWSFMRPIVDISTTAPYTEGTIGIVAGVVTLTGGAFPSWSADGMLKVGDRYYSVATWDSDPPNIELTLDDVTVEADPGTTYELARLEVPLPAEFEAISPDSDLTYYPDQQHCYPPLKQRHDVSIRKLHQSDPRYDRPLLYSVRTVKFDPTVGSRRTLALYPVPDAVYILRVPMLLRPTMLDSTNQYPIGGEMLAQLMIEACLAAAEHNYEEREHVHEKRYLDLLPKMIMKDQERSSPTSLGRDGSVSIPPMTTRAQRMGAIYYEGDEL